MEIYRVMSTDIALVNVSKLFGNLVVFQNFSAAFPVGKVSCILGPSGCGKTTLLKFLSGSLQPDEGFVEGMDGRTSAYVFQEPRLLPWRTVKENLLFVLEGRISHKEAEELAKEYLALVDLTDFSDFYPSQLSGGMKQRVSLARAFCYPSDVILMDEPFTGLDIKLRQNLIQAFLRMWETHPRTVVFVTHNLDEALQMGQYVFVLSAAPARLLFKSENAGDKGAVLKEQIRSLIDLASEVDTKE